MNLHNGTSSSGEPEEVLARSTLSIPSVVYQRARGYYRANISRAGGRSAGRLLSLRFRSADGFPNDIIGNGEDRL